MAKTGSKFRAEEILALLLAGLLLVVCLFTLLWSVVYVTWLEFDPDTVRRELLLLRRKTRYRPLIKVRKTWGEIAKRWEGSSLKNSTWVEGWTPGTEEFKRQSDARGVSESANIHINPYSPWRWRWYTHLQDFVDLLVTYGNSHIWKEFLVWAEPEQICYLLRKLRSLIAEDIPTLPSPNLVADVKTFFLYGYSKMILAPGELRHKSTPESRGAIVNFIARRAPEFLAFPAIQIQERRCQEMVAGLKLLLPVDLIRIIGTYTIPTPETGVSLVIGGDI